MIFTEKTLKATEINELVAYLCGVNNAGVLWIGGRQKIGLRAEKLDNCDLENNLNSFCELKLDLSNDKSYTIEIDRLSPGMHHFIVKDFFDEAAGYIAGGV